MTFLIPNSASAGVPVQAEVDSEDFGIILDGLARTGVLSGGAVASTAAANGSVSVAASRVASLGALLTGAATTVAIAANSTASPRFDLVVVPAAGGAAVARVGTASAVPVFPVPPAGDVVLAAVYVPPGHTATTTIPANTVVDKRVDLPPLPFLAGTTLAAAAATSAVVTFPAAPLLEITVSLAGLSAAGIVGLRLGTTAAPESTARYWHRNHPSLAAAGTAWGSSVQVLSATGLLLNSASTTLPDVVQLAVGNAPVAAHPCQWNASRSSGAPGTAAIATFGAGEYVATTAGQVLSAQLFTSAGNLLAGSALAVKGLAF